MSITLGIAFITSLGAISQMIWSIIQQPEQIVNGLIVVAILAVIIFWVSLWQGIEEPLEPITFQKLGTVGMFTFFTEVRHLFTNYPLWEGTKLSHITLRSNIVSISASMSFVGLILIVAVSIVTGIWVLAGNVAVALAVTWAMAVAISYLSGLRIRVFANAYENQQKQFTSIPLKEKFLALFAFPYFCWFPITATFSLLGFHNFLERFNPPNTGIISWDNWLLSITIWLSIFTLCCILWIYGMRKERASRNPLQGILDDYLSSARGLPTKPDRVSGR